MDPTARFSSRVNNYIRYRPRYPVDVLDTLRQDCGLTASSLVGDIGSGTGALSELFLQNGNEVFAVEPNCEMREAAERLLLHYPGFHSVAGRAEATTLESGSIQFGVVGQAFHWFDVLAARREFLRILVPSGWGMIVWNEREYETTPFMIAYDRLLQHHAPDYARAAHRRVYDTGLEKFFGSGGFVTRRFGCRQELDFEGVKGRMLSSSYTPEPGHPNHGPLIAELARIFAEHAANELVTLEYTTWMYYGHISG